MLKIAVVTGNPGKVRELQILAKGRLEFTLCNLDIDEIQSLDLEAIVKDKAQKAYAYVQAPVIVEDVSAGLKSLKGLPGPFIKFFNTQLGNDALYKLSTASNDEVTITCIAAYYDGKQFVLGRGTV